MSQQILRYGSRIISFISTWPAAMIYTPSNTSHPSLKDQLGIGLTACQQNQLVVGRTWKPHSSTISRASMCDHQTPMNGPHNSAARGIGQTILDTVPNQEK